MEVFGRDAWRLTGAPEAVAAYVRGLESLLQLRSGAAREFALAIALDPTFALAHAGLALLGREFCAPVDVDARLDSATLHARRSTAYERSHVEAVAAHVRGDRSALIRHLGEHPGDALLLSVAVPTIAFAGVTEQPQDAWRLVESCGSAYSQDPWYDGLLAFVRQEQGRFDEAYDLSCSALTALPASGHAAHARAHVHYETADHEAGLAWIDDWMRAAGAGTDNIAHYSWHAALHELSVGDLAAVERRYAASLAEVPGCRGLVDTGSLLWRWQITPGAGDVPPLDGCDPDVLVRPPNPFMGLHAAIALTAADDLTGLGALACWAAAQTDPVFTEVIAPLARALRLLVAGSPSAAADGLAAINDQVWRVGGSDAQREVVEETRLTALLRAGRYDEARSLIDARLDRRRCRRDEMFLEMAQAPARA